MMLQQREVSTGRFLARSSRAGGNGAFHREPTKPNGATPPRKRKRRPRKRRELPTGHVTVIDFCMRLAIDSAEQRLLTAAGIIPSTYKGRKPSLDLAEGAIAYVGNLRERLTDAQCSVALSRPDPADELALKLKNQLLFRDPAKRNWEAPQVEAQWCRVIKAVAAAVLKVPDRLPAVFPAVTPREREAVRCLIERELGEIVRPSNLPSVYYREVAR